MAVRPPDVARRLPRTPLARSAPPPRPRARPTPAALEARAVPDAGVSVGTFGSPGEWGDVGVFRFARAGSTDAPLTINLRTQVGRGPHEAATPGADFAASPSPGDAVTFPAGQATVDVTVAPVDDLVPEPDESVWLSIASGPGYDLGGSGYAWVTIADDDAQLTFAVQGRGGAVGYTVPWDQVDPSAASQSIALADLRVNLAGQLRSAPGATIQFAYGVFAGVTFAVSTAGVADDPFDAVSMAGLTVAVVPRGTTATVTAVAAAAQTGALLDFSSFTTGLAYRLEFKVLGANDAEIDTVTVTIQANATRQDVVTALAGFLDGDKVGAVDKADARLLITSKKTPINKITIRSLNLNTNDINPNITGLKLGAGNKVDGGIYFNNDPVPPKN